MITIRLLPLLCLMLIAPPAAAQDTPPPRLALGLTEDAIRVTAQFAGQRIVVFGVARDLTANEDVVVTLRGPDRAVQVSRKERTAGIWINGAPARLEGAPSYYAAASTRPLSDIAPPANLRRASIGAQYAPLRAVGARSVRFAGRLPQYRQAIVDAYAQKGLYTNDPSGVEVMDAGLFRASFTVPAGAPTGEYEAVAHVFRDGQLQTRKAIALDVRRVGLERIVYDLAHDAPLAYGLMAVAMALAAGWTGAALFRRR